MPADIILKNANVITMAAGQPAARLVAITGDKISIVGGGDELAATTGAGTRIIDCQGKTVVPGFNDAHCHFFSLVRKRLSLDLGPSSVSSIADIKTAIQRRVKDTPPGEWLEGTGFNEFYLAEKRFPNRRDIDEVAPDHPVVLTHRSLHVCVLNSRALSLAGISLETPEPPGGIIDRDLATAEPSGILYEMLGFIRERVMPPLSDEKMNEGVALADRHYLACGITSIQDATVTNDYSRWRFLGRLKESGRLRSRVCMMLGAHARSQFQEAGLGPGSGDSRLCLGAVKVMLREAAGGISPSPDELDRLVLDCHRSGFQVAFHAIEENAVAAAISALEYAGGHSPVVGRRHRIEHCAECPPRLLERLPRLGVVIVTQPPFLYYSGERYLATVAASQLPWLYRIKSPLSQGVVVAGSSDAPVVPDNPLVGIYAAVARRAESGQVLLPGEAVSASQALAMYTLNGACASFEEKEKGSIAPGKLADIVVLSDDPTRVPPEQIKDIRVEMTIIGGEVVWEG
jgi:predicted amidohydrolase YtcJ